MIARLGDRKCTEQVLKGNSEFKYQEEETFVYVFKHDVLDFRIKKKYILPSQLMLEPFGTSLFPLFDRILPTLSKISFVLL
jgi:hypothetical protein